MLNNMKKINDFLNSLDENRIYYRMNKIRPESIMIEVAVPGQRWEIEFIENDSIEIEKFISNGKIYDYTELEVLFNEYSN
ncbi:hypothetical protein R9X47_06240 [Wukongibacter baidiensis]|uniref:hypothetical protein n=1 Tax=Wukongibacter baidiensis TaxID=1723361 RepID=UPI003D7F88C7